VKGLSSVKGWSHYFAIISRVVVCDGEDRVVDSVILGIDVKHAAEAADESVDDDVGNNDDDDDDDEDDDDCSSDEEIDSVASVGLVVPITSHMSVTISGQWYVFPHILSLFLFLFLCVYACFCRFMAQHYISYLIVLPAESYSSTMFQPDLTGYQRETQFLVVLTIFLTV